MLRTNHIDENDILKSETKFLRMIAAGLVVLSLMLMFAVFKMIGAERIILTPPEINRKMWLDDKSVSIDYLEEMGFTYASWALNVTPHTADYQKNLFLKYSDPSQSGALQTDMGARMEFIKRNNASTMFSVTAVRPDQKNMRVAFDGMLITYVSDKKVAERPTVFLVTFRFVNGRVHVAGFKETSTQDPFGLKPQPTTSQPGR